MSGKGEDTGANTGNLVRLRRWQWKELPPYNGFVHIERVAGWQFVNLLVEVGKIDRPRQCAISGATEGLGFHSENYFAWEPYVLCRPIHMALHRRFRNPEEWRRVVDRFAISGSEWFATLSPTPVDLAGHLRRLHGDGVVDIFARAPIPFDIPIDRSQIYSG